MKTKLTLFVSVLAAALFGVGCAATTEQYTTSVSSFAGTKLPQLITKEGYGKIYIFRDKKFVGSAIGFRISDNGRPIGSLGNGGVLAWERQPGSAVIGASASNEQALTISTEAEMVYFFKARVTWGAGFNSGQVEMRMLSPSAGKAQLIGRGILITP